MGTWSGVINIGISMPSSNPRPSTRASTPATAPVQEAFAPTEMLQLIRHFGSEVVHLEISGDVSALRALQAVLEWGKAPLAPFRPSDEQTVALARAEKYLGDKVSRYVDGMKPNFGFAAGTGWGAMSRGTEGQRFLLGRLVERGLENSASNSNPAVIYFSEAGTACRGKMVSVSMSTGMFAINPDRGGKQVRVPAYRVANALNEQVMTREEFLKARFDDPRREA